MFHRSGEHAAKPELGQQRVEIYSGCSAEATQADQPAGSVQQPDQVFAGQCIRHDEAQDVETERKWRHIFATLFPGSGDVTQEPEPERLPDEVDPGAGENASGLGISWRCSKQDPWSGVRHLREDGLNDGPQPWTERHPESGSKSVWRSHGHPELVEFTEQHADWISASGVKNFAKIEGKKCL